jgi:hypothetical protein
MSSRRVSLCELVREVNLYSPDESTVIIPLEHHILRTRREFLTTTASGLGLAALGSLLTQDSILTANTISPTSNPLSPQAAPTSPPKPNPASSSSWKAAPPRWTCLIRNRN